MEFERYYKQNITWIEKDFEFSLDKDYWIERSQISWKFSKEPNLKTVKIEIMTKVCGVICKNLMWVVKAERRLL